MQEEGQRFSGSLNSLKGLFPDEDSFREFVASLTKPVAASFALRLRGMKKTEIKPFFAKHSMPEVVSFIQNAGPIESGNFLYHVWYDGLTELLDKVEARDIDRLFEVVRAAKMFRGSPDLRKGSLAKTDEGREISTRDVVDKNYQTLFKLGRGKYFVSPIAEVAYTQHAGEFFLIGTGDFANFINLVGGKRAGDFVKKVGGKRTVSFVSGVGFRIAADFITELGGKRASRIVNKLGLKRAVSSVIRMHYEKTARKVNSARQLNVKRPQLRDDSFRRRKRK